MEEIFSINIPCLLLIIIVLGSHNLGLPVLLINIICPFKLTLKSTLFVHSNQYQNWIYFIFIHVFYESLFVFYNQNYVTKYYLHYLTTEIPWLTVCVKAAWSSLTNLVKFQVKVYIGNCISSVYIHLFILIQVHIPFSCACSDIFVIFMTIWT